MQKRKQPAFFYRGILILIGMFLLMNLVLAEIIAPRVIHKKLMDMAAACADCRLEIGSISLSLLGSRLVLRDVYLSQGDPAFTQVEARVGRIFVDFSLRDLLADKLTIQKLLISQPQVAVTEGDGRYPEGPAQETPQPQRWKYVVENTEISNGKFLYTRVYKDKAAPIRVSGINGEIGAWSSEERQRPALAKVKGLLESTGHFELGLSAPLFAGITAVDVDLRLREFNLADMNPYFLGSEGIRMHGSLFSGHANVKIREEKQDAWVKARYRGLDLDFHKNRDRGVLEAFFSNLAESLKVQEANLRKTAEEQVRGVSLVRKRRESLVSFVFRGMRDAALRVATD